MTRAATFGYIAGLMLTATTVVVLLTSPGRQLSGKGPMNTGHENLSCQDCHAPVKSGFGYGKVENAQCQGCHQRTQDNHPVTEFSTARFEEARRTLNPEHCVSCHREHQGVRVTMPVDACKHCHQKISIRKDPIDVPHADLVKQGRWETCLGCHDFHGNHVMQVKEKISETISTEILLKYFLGGPSPYAREKKAK